MAGPSVRGGKAAAEAIAKSLDRKTSSLNVIAEDAVEEANDTDQLLESVAVAPQANGLEAHELRLKQLLDSSDAVAVAESLLHIKGSVKKGQPLSPGTLLTLVCLPEKYCVDAYVKFLTMQLQTCATWHKRYMPVWTLSCPRRTFMYR